MENPFESGHIKNYILAYASIIVIMVLFFIAATLFHDVQNVEKKVFSTKDSDRIIVSDIAKTDENKTIKFKLLDKAY